MLRTIWQFCLLRLRITFRQPGVFLFMFLPPLVLSVGLAIAFRPGEESKIRVLVYGDPSLAPRLDGPGLSAEPVASQEEGARRVQRGQVDVLLVAGQPPRVVVGEGRPDARLAQLAVLDALARLEGRRASAALEVAKTPGTSSKYIDFFMPGLLGYTLMSNSLFGLGTLLVELRVGRLLRRLKVSTVNLLHMLLGIAIGQALQALLETAILFGMAYALGARCLGSIPLFAAFAVFSAVSFGGMALALGSRMQSMEGFRGVDVLLMMPLSMVAGVFFSPERFPASLQPVLKAIPLRAAIDGLRGVFTEGVGASALLAPAAVLAVWGVLCFAFSVRFFRWT